MCASTTIELVFYTCILLFIIVISFNPGLQYCPKLSESSSFFIPIKIDQHLMRYID